MLVLLKSKFWDDVAENCFLLAAKKSEPEEKKIMEKKVYTVLIFYFLFDVHHLPSLP